VDECLERRASFGRAPSCRDALRVPGSENGLLVGIPRGLNQTCDHGETAIAAWLKVWMPTGRAEGIEVPIDDRNIQDAFAGNTRTVDGVVALEPQSLLDFAFARATIQIAQIAVVALFIRTEQDTVAAGRGAFAAARTLGFRLALRVATIEGDRVAIVAAFCALSDLVTAGGTRAFAWTSRALKAEFDSALGVAAIAIGGIAIVAAFVWIGDTVTAGVYSHAWSAGIAAAIADLHEITLGGTTVASNRVAIVTGFARFQDAIAAYDLR